MARPIGGRLSEVFRDTYQNAGLTQTDIADRLTSRGWTTIDQSKVSKWARGMERIPLDVLPDLDDVCGVRLGHLLIQAGYVADGLPTVEQAIQSDPHLNAADRNTLLSLYKFFRAGSPASAHVSPM